MSIHGFLNRLSFGFEMERTVDAFLLVSGQFSLFKDVCLVVDRLSGQILQDLSARGHISFFFFFLF